MKRKGNDNINILGTFSTLLTTGLLSNKNIRKKKITVINDNFNDNINNLDDINRILNQREDESYYFNFKYHPKYKKIVVNNFENFIIKIKDLVENADIIKDKERIILTSGIVIKNDITISKLNSITIEGKKYRFDQIYLNLIGKLLFGNNNKKVTIYFDSVGINNIYAHVNIDSTILDLYNKGYSGLLRLFTSVKEVNTNISISKLNNSPIIKNIIVDSKDNNRNTLKSIKTNMFTTENIDKYNITYDIEGSGYLIQSYSQYFKLFNCENKNKIKQSFTGGLCGSFIGYNGHVKIYKCKNSGNLENFSQGGLAGNYVGYKGIIEVKDCKNSGDINGADSGGLFGRSFVIEGISEINNCENTGNLNNDRVGGLIGIGIANEGKAFINNCKNSGEIKDCIQTGGLCAIASNNGICQFLNCINSGDINGRNIGYDGNGGLFGGNNYYNYNYSLNIKMVNCINTGNINSTGGGLLGANIKGPVNIYNCINTGRIGIKEKDYTQSPLGGFFGQNPGMIYGKGGECNIYTSLNLGDINANCSGGFFADFAGSNPWYDDTERKCFINNSVNKGDINGDESGGFYGYNAAISTYIPNNGNNVVDNCVNEGNINGINSGGIFGAKNRGKSIITNTINKGDIKGTESGGFYGGDTKGDCLIDIFSKNLGTGELITLKSGQMLGSISNQYDRYDYAIPSIKIAKNTTLLESPFDNSQKLTKFSKNTVNILQVTGNDNANIDKIEEI